MNKLYNLILIICIYGCIGSNTNNQNSKERDAVVTSCKHSVDFGSKKICLPEIDGMEECYSNPKVKSLADEYEYSANSVLAFYLNNETHEQVDQLGDFSFDDYFKIYAMNKLADVEVSKNQFNDFAQEMSSNFIRKNWNDLKREIENQNFDFSVGQPVLLEDYSINGNSHTFVLLMNLRSQDFENVLVCTMNMILVKERLIWLSYYKNYDGNESIKTAKAKSDYITHSLISENE